MEKLSLFTFCFLSGYIYYYKHISPTIFSLKKKRIEGATNSLSDLSQVHFPLLASESPCLGRFFPEHTRVKPDLAGPWG